MDDPETAESLPQRQLPRPGGQIMAAVLKALLIREALTRLFGGRAAWFWLMFEPVFHVVYLMFIFSVVRVRVVGGIDTALWLMVGLIGYFLFQRTATQSMSAIHANRSLYVFRQIKPVDTVIARAVLEGALALVEAVLLCFAVALFGIDTMPDDPLAVLVALATLWLAGLGFGLVASVAIRIVPELGNLLKMAMAPLYLLSGVMFPISAIPYPYREWLMLNPVAHGLESIRLGFAPHYHAIESLSTLFPLMFSLVLIFCGLGLQVGFSKRLIAQ